jgi:hypothetical protein
MKKNYDLKKFWRSFIINIKKVIKIKKKLWIWKRNKNYTKKNKYKENT